MFKERYQRMNAHIHPGDKLIESTLAAAKPTKNRMSLPRLAKAVPVLALLLALTIATPALAAGVPAINEMLYLISPEAAMHFRPVNRVCTDNGVTVELMAVNIYDNDAQMYISVQGDMIDETVDLFDNYKLDTSRFGITRCELETYLPDSNTALFFIDYFHEDGSPIEGQKLTFTLTELLTNKQEYEVDLTYLMPDTKEEAPSFKCERITAWSGRNGANPEQLNPSGLVLTPADKPSPIVEGTSLSAIGYVDGTLRVQLRFENAERNDNDTQSFIWFETPDGWIIADTSTLIFWDGDACLHEYIYTNIPEDAMLKGYFTTCDSVSGDWSITFPLVEYGS